MFGYDENGATLNTRDTVYGQMLLDICSHYHCLPPVRSLTFSEIEYFYRGIVPSLIKITKPGT